MIPITHVRDINEIYTLLSQAHPTNERSNLQNVTLDRITPPAALEEHNRLSDRDNEQVPEVDTD